MFNKIFPYYNLLSKFLCMSINSFLILKANSTFGEFVLNYVKIDTFTANLLTVTENQNKKFLLIILNYIIPFLSDLLSRLINNRTIKISQDFIDKFTKILKSIKFIKIILDLGYKLAYIFKNRFIYSDVIDHLLGIMTVAQGSKEAFSDKFLNIGKQLNLFFMYMFIRFGEWFYQKETKNEIQEEVEPPLVNKKTHSENCPICHNDLKRINNTIVAARCCGFVFCENCIINHLNLNAKCPMCSFNINLNYLFRIYQ
jgi:hypothetical protein